MHRFVILLAVLTLSAAAQKYDPYLNRIRSNDAAGLVIGVDVQAYDADLTTWAGITPSANVVSFNSAADYAAMKTLLSLDAVENTALSTWTGSAAVTTLGAIDSCTSLAAAGSVTAEAYAEVTYAKGSVSGAVALSYADGGTQTATAGGEITAWSLTNCPAGKSCVITLILDTNGQTIATNAAAGLTTAGGEGLALTADGVDVITFFTPDGGTTVYAFQAGADMQ